MTSLRTWSSGSTSRLALLGVGLALLSGGCATHTRPAPPPPLRGYVNLDALTRRHPGWGGVSRYDAALKRLATAARSLPPVDRPDQKIATLPALPPAPVGGGEVLPPADVGQAKSRLSAVQRSLLDGLRSRREMARADQIASQQDGWQRAARQQYPAPTGAVAIQPDLELQVLQANIDALTQTLNSKLWEQAPPPAPRREALRAKVEADRARLQDLIAGRAQARDSAQARQEEAGRRLREARIAYAQAQADALGSRLRASDERFIADQQGRLTHQRTALLGALALSVPVVAPAFGDAGAQTLPKGPDAGQAALAQASLKEAEAHLSAQRARWIRHLYDDTMAAARDTASRRNWDVTFGPPRPGDRDLTQPLAQAMRVGVWRG